MTSGIYKLTFSSGRTYIGKSIDIPTRWKQHHDKFQKGTAARNMQAEYNSYGSPEAEIIYYCHADHIDLMEAFFIARLQPELNTSRPEDPFPGLVYEELNKVVWWFNMSTLDHAKLLNKYTEEKDELTKSVEALEEEVEYLNEQRSEEEILADKEGRIEILKDEVLRLENQNTRLQSRVVDLEQELTYHRLPWWKKLFN